MPVVSMENQYIKPDGTLTYEGQNLLQDLLETAEAAISIDNLSDVTITTPTTGQILRYNGTAWVNVTSGTPILLATKTASASATLNFTEFNNAVYRRYEFDLENVFLATDDLTLFLRTSTNGGSSYDSGASDYQWSLTGMSGATAVSTGSTGAGSINLTNSTAGNRIGNAAGEYGVNGIIVMFNAGNAASATDIQTRISYFNTATAYSQYIGSGVRAAAADVDAVRFLPTSGNITSGTIRMYGIV